MKNIFSLLLLAFIIVSCKNNEQKTELETVEVETPEIAYASFGDKIEADNAVDASVMAEKFKAMQVGDSVSSKMVAKVDEVCQAKGCWMRLDLGNDEQVMVKFKDYGFFMPKNIAGKEVIINGKAFVEETPVEELRHFAEDAGKSEEEIAAITEPKRTYSFLADGVLLIEE
ncbi:DUF4920 domain-containing protein [Hanstruepera marina]|uniref:DUF4920 domain-containing protein n=1 Tax=Hanstruepera marina TaxID=2873265 RepID=UPI001CA737E7|nr:DUF4920 domain-containing protein [Hanstruepera marina]